MDKVCKMFSKHFYQNLLNGWSIIDSFNSSLSTVRVSSDCGQIDICCCAHPHKEDCWWNKLSKEDWKLAHALHTSNCGCNLKNRTLRKHLVNCPDLIKFNTKMK